ncbi:ankyrin repeat domain-containing protein 50-like [Haliotis asinina]|uniref:ankyrin repeat domain-containing protein 50-like n=1 Tax=Haliotis asinina TaxID=109174 RepID=UPI003532654C
MAFASAKRIELFSGNLEDIVPEPVTVAQATVHGPISPPLCDLHTVSKTGNLSGVKFLLSQGRADINCREWTGRTPVMLAAGGRHREVVKLLVSKGANIKLVDRFGINILHSACLVGDVEVVKYVLSQNMLDINSRVKCGRTAVMLAAGNGNKDLVQLFVDKGADVSLLDKTGDNILHCACRGGGAEVLKYILSKDMVDINSLGHRKRTPVIVAAERGQKEVVELLVKHGADLSLSERSGGNILHHVCQRGHYKLVKYVLSLNMVDIHSRWWMKRTPVMVAAKYGHKEVVKLLVNHGANLLQSDKRGDNILHLVCFAGHSDIVKYILSLNSVNINSRGWKGRTPVMVAAERGHKEVVELLVNHGVNLSLCKRSGSNILHLACCVGHFDVVKYVLSLNSVDINSRGWKGRTPVMVGAKHGHKEVVKLLVNHGANVLLSDKRGDNILHLVCFAGHSDVVKYILSLNSVDIDSRGWKGRTPVMIAAEQGHKEVVELLVNHGTDFSLSENVWNILQNACYHGQLDLVKYVPSLNSVEIKSRGLKKRAPVMIAAELGLKEVVELLERNVANLSLTDEDGKNIVDLASKRGHLEVAQYVMSL